MASPFVVLGNPDCRRVALFQEALDRLGAPPARVVAWLDFLSGQARLDRVLQPGDALRIESPGRDWEVERALLRMGAEVPDTGALRRLSRQETESLRFERGRIHAPRQWYLGFRRALEQAERQLAGAPWHRRMNSPSDIARMFDKPSCHELLRQAGIATARSLGEPEGYDDLRQRMAAGGFRRVFVKLAHGSSASGVVAYQTDGRRHHAVTTVERVEAEGEVRLYNTRRLRVHQSEGEIAGLVDALCRHRVHAEEWLPKAGLDGCTFDLRVVVIAGQARHVLPRLSRGPMTNLHLLNRRGDPEAARRRMGTHAWEAILETCRRTLALFPGSHHAGLDVLVAPGFRRHAVAEVNAFGDLLPGALCEGLDTYAYEAATFNRTEDAPQAWERACWTPAA